MAGQLLGSNLIQTVSNGLKTLNTLVNKLPAGAQPVVPTAASVSVKNASGEVVDTDMRVRIVIPPSYVTDITGRLLNSNFDGQIIFPYTPFISTGFKANYSHVTPVHSNYAQYFFTNSEVSPININAKMTVQNESDAATYISIIHCLRALTKMKYGGSTGDSDSGAPPPVCRLYGHGAMMFDNIPVVIASFSTEYADNVDYYTYNKRGIFPQGVDATQLPTLSTLSLSLYPVYSRAEQQKFSVSGYLKDQTFRKSGYL
jgi:hypothetical protein